MGMRILLAALVWASTLAVAGPRCDDPAVRRELASAWDRMASRKGGNLAGSRVTVWNLRQDGKPGECRADFLARKPDASIGGSLPYAVRSGAKGKIEVESRGEPTLNLLQADTTSETRKPQP